MRFDQKVVVVTGGGGGIGASACMAFSKEGAKVVVADGLAERGEACANAITQGGGDAMFVLTDVSKSSDVKCLVEAAVEKFGGIDILFNNHGLKQFGSVTETDEEMWDNVVGANLKGMFLCSKYCIPVMLKRGGGVIINNGQANLTNTTPRLAAYSASKAGIVGLTRSLAVDYGPSGIRVNCISPNFIETPMLTEVVKEFSLNADNAKKGWAESLAAKRLGEPKDVADLVLFLASEESTFIHSAVIPINGGKVAAGAKPEERSSPGE